MLKERDQVISQSYFAKEDLEGQESQTRKALEEKDQERVRAQVAKGKLGVQKFQMLKVELLAVDIKNISTETSYSSRWLPTPTILAFLG